MTNKVEIVVVTKDDTKATNAKIKSEFIKLGDDIDKVSKSSGDRAGNSLFSGISSGLKKAGQLGAQAGSAIGDGLGSALGKDPKIAAGIVAAAASAAPLAGATLSAAITGAVGVGAVAGAIALVKDDARVKAAGEALGENLLGDLRQSASVVIEPLLAAIDKVGGRLDGLGGDFDRIFGRAATFIEPLTDGLLEAADSITGGLADAIDGALPVIEAASKGIANLGDAIGDTFSDMADNGASNAEALTIVLGALEGAIRATGEVTNFLADQYRNLSYGVHMLVGDTEGANALFEQTPPLVQETTSAYQDAEEAVQELADEQRELTDALYDAAGANRDAITAALDYKEALSEAKDAVDGLNTVSDDEMRKLTAVAERADKLSASLRESGASTEEMSRAVNQGRQDVFNLGVSMGLSREKAQELANRLVTMPPEVNTNVNVNAGTARSRLAEIQYLLGTIRSKTITVDVIESIYRQDDALARRANGRAAGGPAGGLTWVGEQGPELVRLPYGSGVMTNGDSMRAAGASGQGAPTQVVLTSRGTGDPFSSLVDALIPYIQASVKNDGGGDVNWLAGTGTW